MVRCFVAGCDHQNDCEPCSFFKFPLDTKLSKKWTEFSRRDATSVTSSSRICSCHFKGGLRENGPTVFCGGNKRRKHLSSVEDDASYEQRGSADEVDVGNNTDVADIESLISRCQLAVPDLRSTLYQYQKTGYLCDTVLIADDIREIKVHSVVLAASSSTFKSTLKKSEEAGKHIVRLSGLNFTLLETVVDFVYTGYLCLPDEYRTEEGFSSIRQVFKQLGVLTTSDNVRLPSEVNVVSSINRPAKSDVSAADVHSENDDAYMLDNTAIKLNSSNKPSEKRQTGAIGAKRSKPAAAATRRMASIAPKAASAVASSVISVQPGCAVSSSANMASSTFSVSAAQHQQETSSTSVCTNSKQTTAAQSETIQTESGGYKRIILGPGSYKGISWKRQELVFVDPFQKVRTSGLRRETKETVSKTTEYNSSSAIPGSRLSPSGERTYSNAKASGFDQVPVIHCSDATVVSAAVGDGDSDPTLHQLSDSLSPELRTYSVLRQSTWNAFGDLSDEVNSATGSSVVESSCSLHAPDPTTSIAATSVLSVEQQFKNFMLLKYRHMLTNPSLMGLKSLSGKFVRFLSDQIATKMLNPDQPKCIYCSTVCCGDRMLLQMHIMSCHSDLVVNDFLGMLQNKEASSADAPDSFVCEFCGWTCVDRYQFNNHRAIHGGDQKLYSCTECGRRFLYRSRLKKHRAFEHGVGDIARLCDICGQKFKEGYIWRDHMLCSHGKEMAAKFGVEPYFCDVCSESFFTRRQLTHHKDKLSHHRQRKKIVGSDVNECDVSGGSQPKKRYFCNFCDSSYTFRNNLRVHVRQKHKGFTCSLCSRLFVSETELKNHVKGYTDKYGRRHLSCADYSGK